MRFIISIFAFIGILVLSGCQSKLTGDTYSRNEARESAVVNFGVIESLRPVVIEGTKTPVGTLAGAAVGGVAGSSIGGGTGSTLAAIGGALAGGLAGSSIEENMTKVQGIEITVKEDRGITRAYVQEVDPNTQFRVGDRVRISTIRGTSRVALD